MKNTLTKQQRGALVEWAAEGCRLPEINERAAKSDPPFTVDAIQLKHVRKRYQVRFTQLREQWESEAVADGLARRAVRIHERSKRHDLLNRIVVERGVDESMQEIAGGKTGLLVRDYKGTTYQPVYKLDAALLKELRDLEREIAVELGQWAEKKEISGPNGGAIPVAIGELLNKVYGGENIQQSGSGVSASDPGCELPERSD